MYQALYRKWRPRTFDEVAGQPHITETLKRQVETGRLSHAYLFTGSRGTGKTTCAKILARAVNCENPQNGNPCNRCPSCLGIENGSILDVLELDAASNSGVDQVRALRDEAVYTPAAVRKRVYIIDEVHMLSTAAFNALLKIMEEPPAHLMFILATTELHKVPATILSRCQRFSFRRILPSEIGDRLMKVSSSEGIGLTEDGAALLSRLADGSLRDALSLLDQCSGAGTVIDSQEVLASLGLAGNLRTAALFRAAADRDAGEALAVFSELYAAGKDVSAVLGELLALARDLLILKTAPQGGIPLLGGGYDNASLRELDKGLSAGRLIYMIGVLQEASAALSRSPSRRAAGELCLMRLCDESLSGDPADVLARISRLEELLENAPEGARAHREPVKPRPSSPPRPAGASSGSSADIPGEIPLSKKAEAAPVKADTDFAAGSNSDDFRPKFLASAKESLGPAELSILDNPDMVSLRLQKNTLLLETDGEFTRSLLNKQEIKDVLLRAAKRSVSADVTSVQILLREAKPPERDKLDDLIQRGRQFSNITIK
ncbi:DNA polymerase III subunit gamma/tau [Papillibacter cinnamivorans]|uniref:DNA-directed DNA polymerase n=1 Tax=Papillibacter cinnamivorans DSM 12816 TaxID=1122930 RepID=A0A1W2BF93_9FIRM|nr:DNA polymerase III subunit gamma/tau [Papillibacter cinnamivorans]SMC71526.1 DNA polymerase-3 subunit gamma/tau [Papillibacter cinnamivorans DSM 12816]